MTAPVPAMLSGPDFQAILGQYDLGAYRGFRAFATGGATVTALVETNRGRYVVRTFVRRTPEHVRYEVRLTEYLRRHAFPTPRVLRTRSGDTLASHRGYPVVVLEFVEGAVAHEPNLAFDRDQAAQIAHALARLHGLTVNYGSGEDRQPFDVAYAWRAFAGRHRRLLGTEQAAWFKAELDTLEIPETLPRGVCHADVNHGNFLFRGEQLVAVLDFDMAFRTVLVYDVASLVYWWAWPPSASYQAERAALLIARYEEGRTMTLDERAHVFDGLKLITLLGIAWSDEADLAHERAKIETLNGLGRARFAASLA